MDSKNEDLVRWLVDGYKFKLNRVEDLLDLEEPPVKISIYKPDGIEEATRFVFDEFGTELKLACAGDMWMDCMALGVNKGNAVKNHSGESGYPPGRNNGVWRSAQ